MTGLNTSSTSYTARLFATDIQDQAGNDLDGINSGTAGQDAALQFGHAAFNTTVTLATSGVWNSSLPIILAPTQYFQNAVVSLATTTYGGVPSTLFTFPNTSAYTQAISGTAGDEIILEDFTGTFAGLNGVTTVSNVLGNKYSFEVPINSSTFNDSSWVSGSSGSVYYPAQDERIFINALKTITGATSIPTTGLANHAGLFLGYTGEYDTSSTTDSLWLQRTVRCVESELGVNGYIVRSDNSGDLFVLGATANSEQNAIDAFLQSPAVGLEDYGPGNNDNNTNVWQVTPSLPTLSGSWDIRQVPSIAYVENNNFGLGTVNAVQNAWDTFMNDNFGGGSPIPQVNQTDFDINGGSFNGHADSLLVHPDWWAEGNDTNTVNSLNSVVTYTVPTGVTINVGDTFAISLYNINNTVTQTLTITATSPRQHPRRHRASP